MAKSLKYVLVIWTDEPNKMSVLQMDWVRGIDEVTFDGEGRPVYESSKPPTLVAEWRVGKKDKISGWPLHRTTVIMASGRHIARPEIYTNEFDHLQYDALMPIS